MFEQRHNRPLARPLWKTAAGTVMMALFSLLLAVSLSREIHHFFHSDSQSPDHHCVATQMAAGQLLESPGVSVLVKPALPEVFSVSFSDCCRLSAGDLRLMPERAPPSSLT